MASTRAGFGAQARWRRREATVEARKVVAYAAEDIGTFLVLIFISAVISVGNAGVLGPALASCMHSDFWIYIVGPVVGALLAEFGYRALVLER